MLDGFLALATPNIITYENANNYEFLFSCHCYSVWWIISESTMRFHYRWRFSLPVCPSISTSSTCWPGTFWPGMAPAAATSSHPWLPPQTPDQLNKQLIPCKGLMVSESWPQINCNLLKLIAIPVQHFWVPTQDSCDPKISWTSPATGVVSPSATSCSTSSTAMWTTMRSWAEWPQCPTRREGKVTTWRSATKMGFLGYWMMFHEV